MQPMLRAFFLVLTSCAVACSAEKDQAAAPKTAASSDRAEDCVASSLLGPSAPSAELPGDAIILHAGDRVCLVPAANGAWTSVPQAAAQSPHLSIQMIGEQGRTTVEAQNYTQTRVHYRAAMQLPGSRGWRETSILPVMPGLYGFEAWPHPIDALAIFGLQKQ